MQCVPSENCVIRYPMVCSKWMSSTDAVIQEHPACLSAGRRVEKKEKETDVFNVTGHDGDFMNCGVRKRTLKRQWEIFKNILARVVRFPTRQAGCGVHPLQQLSHTQLPTVVGVTWQHNLTHLHLSGVSVPFLGPLDEDRALHRLRFIFRCHNSAAHGKCKIVKAWIQVCEMTYIYI